MSTRMCVYARKYLKECRKIARDVMGTKPAYLSQKQQEAVNVWRAFKETGYYEYTMLLYSDQWEGKRRSVCKFHFELD